MKFYRFTLLFILAPSVIFAQIRISGRISESGSGETLPYVQAFNDSKLIATSDVQGFYSLNIRGNAITKIQFVCLGYLPKLIVLNISADTVMNVELRPNVRVLDDVVIKADSIVNLRTRDAAVIIQMKDVKHTPALLGEKDAFKTIQLLSGVARGTEGSSSLYIRGGTPGQNLILLDDAPVYNAYHLFGFFSVVNADALKNVTLYKDGFPARYGGRVSSVVDMRMREGSRDTLHANGGVGILSSRLSLEGPFANKRGSFLFSGRRSYFDLLTLPFQTRENKQRYTFGDLSAKASYDLTERDRVYLSSYFGSDQLSSTGYENGSAASKYAARLGWRNLTTTARWNRRLSLNTTLNTTLVYTSFKFETSSETNNSGSASNTFAQLNSSIDEMSVKSELTQYLNNQHTLLYGMQLSTRAFRPRAFQTRNSDSTHNGTSSPKFVNREYSLFVEDEWRYATWLKMNFGVRLNGLTNTSFHFLEPRLAVSHLLKRGWIISESYSRMNQFSHLISNTGLSLPTDIWIPSTSITPPEQSDQFALRVTKNWQRHGISLSVETFRKYLRNIVGYASNASFVQVGDNVSEFRWEDNVTIGNSVAYGTEVFIEGNFNKLTAWIGYTLSWTVNRFDQLNQGKPFFPTYANRHNISTFFVFHITPKISTSVTWVFGSGNYLTVPSAYSTMNYLTFSSASYRPSLVPYQSSINNYKGDSYHRLDLSIQFSKQKRKYRRSWEFGLFNAYNRKNPFYYYLKQTYVPEINGSIVSLHKRSLFPIIPYASWNFQF